MSFSWIPFYREVAQTLLGYESKQNELLALLREMKAEESTAIPLEENMPDGTMAALEEIDPFTFMANLARVELPRFIRLCTWLKKKWQLKSDVPSDWDGRIAISARGGGSWFFASQASGRTPEEVGRLWTLAREAFDGKAEDLNAELFQLCITHNNLGVRKLTNGLSWFSPKGFLPLGDPVLDYLKANGVEFDVNAVGRGDLNAYRQLMQNAHEINFDNPALVKAAYAWKKIAPLALAPLQKNFPLNQILYGPPGTGKTYNSIERAVEIITGEKLPHAEAKERFDELRLAGQIEFVTFHQSFSYEEFIEGLRPVLDDEGDGTARYDIRDGILKDLALRAMTPGHTKSLLSDFEAAWQELKRRVLSGQLLQLNGLNPERSHYNLSLEGDKLLGENSLSSSDTNVFYTTKTTQQKAWKKLSEDTVNSSKFDVGPLFHRSFGAATYNHLKLVAADLANNNTPSFIGAPRYVLIVDEINRGNISKILGELITLLEDDKRLGAPNELRVKLPVSGDSFCLPPNLYILGTMNTADKSLALLDIALRRRFSFVEMPPRVELFPEFARALLQMLNLRLEAALDREHRLGHAYFIGCKDEEGFNRVFRDKIIPLLQEFFYNDWETLRAVLGESSQNSEKSGFIRSLKALKGMKARTKWRWWFDANSGEELNCFAVLKANYDKLNADTPDGDE